MRALVVALSVVGLTACHPRGTHDIPPPPDDRSLFLFTNGRAAEVTLDIQELRADVVGNCTSLTSTNPRIDPTRIDPALFGDSHTLRVAPGQSTPYLASDRARERLSAAAPCAVFKLTDDGGRTALLAPTGRYTTSIDVTPAAFQGSWLMQHGDSYPPPEQCSPMTRREVGWSEPVPVGNGMALKSATRDGDCALLAIGTGEIARSTAGADLAWRVCGALGGDGADLPMHAGDRVDVSISGGAFRVVRVSWTHGPDAHTLLIGSGIVDQATQTLYERGQVGGVTDTKLQVQATLDRACATDYGACGVSTPASLVLTVGNRTFQARAGEALTIGRERASTEMVVGTASIGLLTVKDCDAGPTPGVQLSIMERSRRGAIEVAQ